MTEIEKSQHWDDLKDSTGFIEEGFPFDEGFPKDTSPNNNKDYTLVFRDGTRLTGSPDYSSQYSTEGMAWRIHQPSEFSTLGRQVIAAWCENPTQNHEA